MKGHYMMKKCCIAFLSLSLSLHLLIDTSLIPPFCSCIHRASLTLLFLFSIHVILLFVHHFSVSHGVLCVNSRPIQLLMCTKRDAPEETRTNITLETDFCFTDFNIISSQQILGETQHQKTRHQKLNTKKFNTKKFNIKNCIKNYCENLKHAF